MLAVTVTVPAAVVVRVFPLIVALVVPDDFTVHTMVLLVAFAGPTVPERVSVPTEAVVGTPVIPVTATKVDEVAAETDEDCELSPALLDAETL